MQAKLLMDADFTTSFLVVVFGFFFSFKGIFFNIDLFFYVLVLSVYESLQITFPALGINPHWRGKQGCENLHLICMYITT